jgi:hypothetical protein
MTRALVSLAQGNVRQSLREHPFAIGTALYFGMLQAVAFSEILALTRPERADAVVAAGNRILSVGLLSAWAAKLAGARLRFDARGEEN